MEGEFVCLDNGLKCTWMCNWQSCENMTNDDQELNAYQVTEEDNDDDDDDYVNDNDY